MASDISTSVSRWANEEAVLHCLSVSQYHQMIETRILTENDRVELLEGVLIEMAAIGSRHSTSVQLTAASLDAILPVQWQVRTQQPMTLETSEPEPDVAVARGTIRDYTDHHPKGSDIGLVVEVADSTLELDRNQKGSIYAAAGIPEYWIVNLIEVNVEVYRDPKAGHGSRAAQYQSKKTLSVDATLVVTLDGQRIGDFNVSDLLP